MALDPKSKKDVQEDVNEVSGYVRDTLQSVASSFAETLKDAVKTAFDPTQAGTLKALARDLSKTFNDLAKMNDSIAKNTGRITAGLLTQKDITKQKQGLDEKIAELARRKEAADLQGVKYSQKNYEQVVKSLDVQKSLLETDEDRVKEIEKNIGLTGKLVSSLKGIPGIGKFLKTDEIEVEMRKVAAAGGDKFATMGKAASMIGTQLMEGLLDPATAVATIVKGFLDVNKAAVEFGRLTGDVQGNFKGIFDAGFNSRQASTVDVLKVMTDITKQIGTNANSIFSDDDLGRLAEAKNLLGISAEQATNLGIRSKISGQGIETYQKAIVTSVNSYNGLNGKAIAHGLVLQDVLSTSDEIALSLGGDAGKIANAAAAARGLGLGLDKVNQIADSMLNFEDSIGNELEAQLLTGKNINLSKAREYALNNDLAGLSAELAKNGASAAEFANMNRIEQTSLAKALGMSRDELAKTIMTQEASKNLTAQQRADAEGVTLAQLQQQDIQSQIQTSMDKLSQSFAPLLSGIIPIISAIVPVVTLIAQAIEPIATTFGFLFKIIPVITGKFSEWGDDISQMIGPLGMVGTAVKYLAELAVVYAAYLTFAAVSAALAATVIGGIAAPVIGAAAAAVVLGAGLGFLGSIKDGVIDPKKGPIVSGDFGSVQLHPNDQIAAGTDLFGAGSKGTLGTSASTPNADMTAVVNKLQELINVAKQGTVVKIDGKTLATANIRNSRLVASGQP